MSEKTRSIEGYQPVLIKGYQPKAPAQTGKGQNPTASTPVVPVNIIPPKGGTGEVSRKK